MKNYKRALRRHNKHVKFKRRVKNWFKDTKKYEKWYLETLEGKRHTFLKTTARPCNCIFCCYDKYKREPKFKVKKKMFEDIT